MIQKFTSLFSQVEISTGDIDGLPTGNNTQSGVDDIMGWVFILVVGIATVVIIIAGINFITSKGDPQKTTSARNTIIYAIVGIIIAALATSIIRFIAENVS